MASPHLTVVIPVLNGVNFIERCILSVLESDYPKLELIVMDGGSDDGTLDVIRKYERYIAYWESEKDRGQAHAINKGILRAKGDFIAWQNADDIFLPGAIQKFAQKISEKPEYDVYYGHILVIDEKDRVIDRFRVRKFSQFFNLYDDIIVHNQAAFFRRTKVIEVGMLDENLKFCFDLDLVAKLGNFGAKFFPIDEYLGAFRIHSSSKTSKILDVWRKEREIVIRRYRKFPIPQRPSYYLCKLIKLIELVSKGDFSYIFGKIKKRLNWKR